MTVFVDTSAILAILNADDEYHSVAVALWKQLLAQEERLHRKRLAVSER